MRYESKIDDLETLILKLERENTGMRRPTSLFCLPNSTLFDMSGAQGTRRNSGTSAFQTPIILFRVCSRWRELPTVAFGVRRLRSPSGKGRQGEGTTAFTPFPGSTSAGPFVWIIFRIVYRHHAMTSGSYFLHPRNDGHSYPCSVHSGILHRTQVVSFPPTSFQSSDHSKLAPWIATISLL